MMREVGKQTLGKKPVLWFSYLVKSMPFWDEMISTSVVLIVAVFLDYLIGDPWGWPHPVRVMGWVISHCWQFSQSYCQSSLTQRLAGIIVGVILIIGSGLIGWLIIESARQIHPGLGMITESILLASCFAFRSLRAAAADVLQPLIAGDIEAARQILSNYVGRDTENLSKIEILRAILETVTENATDGVMAPLFYAIVGAFIPFVGAAPLALAYKASSTLDSMIGYREAPYTYFGWFSARLEDGLTWFPCRLTVMSLAILSGQPLHVWRICCRDAITDPSPNSGWSECAYAAILGVQMGGANCYGGVIKHKPLLGDAINPITPNSITSALQLTRYCFLLWLGVAITFKVFI